MKRLRPPSVLQRRFMLTAFLTLMIAASAWAQDSSNQTAAAIEKIFSEAFPADAPGAAVLVVRNDSVLLRKGFGLANLELRVPVAPEHVFRIGSITKQFTAVAVLQLAAAGRIKLDDDISAYVPDFPGAGRKVTIAQLLNQTSGLASYTDEKKWLTTWRQDVTPADLLAFTAGKPLLFDPGTNWAYSNTNYVLLGEVIAKASGETYASYLQTKVLGPAGMEHTQYDNPDDVIAGRVPGYAAPGPKKWKNAAYLSMTQPYSAGALISTVDDLWKWDKALSAGKLVSPKLLADAHRNTVLPDGRSTGYGYGWSIGTVGQLQTIEHGGGINGFSAYEMKVPDAGLYVVILSNNEAAAPLVGAGALAFKVARAVLGQEIEPKLISIAPERLRDFVGVYRIKDDAKREVSMSDGRLIIQRTGGPKSPGLTAISDNEFVLSDFGIRFRFTRGPDGAVNALVVKPRVGPDEVCPKDR
ncbi:MAG TPA: serine hydrolase [Chthoniobacterales bacterium]|nr:serine hydrolase [Chthoniobacterales bacterium]